MKKPPKVSQSTSTLLTSSRLEGPGAAVPSGRLRDPVCSPIFHDAVVEYLAHVRACGRSPLTIESYAGSLALLAEHIGPGASLDSVSPDLLNIVVAAFYEAGELQRPYRSEATLNRHRSAYRTFWKWAFETGRTARNAALPLHLARIESPPTRAITPIETKLFLSTIRQSDDGLRLRDEALFCTYAMTGLRRSEALRLDISDYDPVNKTLHVRNAKGRRVRIVPVAPALGTLLDEIREVRLERGESDQKLFVGRIPGKGLTARQAQARFDVWKTIAKLPSHLTIHSFRAGFATAIHDRSGDLILVSRALGHKDIRPTLRYVHLLPDKLREAIEGLGQE